MVHFEGNTEKTPQEIMQEAMNLHRQHNHDDEEWLKGLGLPETVQTEILLRMIVRGGYWLEFIERLTGYQGGYRVLTEVSP
jgi:hypothetical protein